MTSDNDPTPEAMKAAKAIAEANQHCSTFGLSSIIDHETGLPEMKADLAAKDKRILALENDLKQLQTLLDDMGTDHPQPAALDDQPMTTEKSLSDRISERLSCPSLADGSLTGTERLLAEAIPHVKSIEAIERLCAASPTDQIYIGREPIGGDLDWFVGLKGEHSMEGTGHTLLSALQATEKGPRNDQHRPRRA